MWSDSDIGFMRAAMTQAEQALWSGEVPVGAVIVSAGEIICAAHNMREATGDPTAHAEILALREAARLTGGWRLGGCRMYVTLEPCPMCAGAIVQSRLGGLIYGAHDPASGCAGSILRLTEDPAFNHFCPANGGLLGEECQAIIDKFMSSRRRKD